jgi:chorismate lyase/3-hydroxybenzoate synthase
MQFTLQFGSDASAITRSDDGIVVHLAVPILRGDAIVNMLSDPSAEIYESGRILVFKTERFQLGGIVLSEGDLETRAREVYDEVLEASEGYHLLRAWNYVPFINENVDGMENYRRFCVGRANAFAASGKPMSAASAVGIDSEALVVYYLASKSEVQHFENPEQVPAYHYPSRYGPKSPSFSRASMCCHVDGKSAFISGTASIKGHLSLHPDSLEKQTETTLDNLKLMVEALGIEAGGPFLDENTIYLRDPKNLDEFLKILQQIDATESKTRILKADICRKELLVEIETHRFY